MIRTGYRDSSVWLQALEGDASSGASTSPVAQHQQRRPARRRPVSPRKWRHQSSPLVRGARRAVRQPVLSRVDDRCLLDLCLAGRGRADRMWSFADGEVLARPLGDRRQYRSAGIPILPIRSVSVLCARQSDPTCTPSALLMSSTSVMSEPGTDDRPPQRRTPIPETGLWTLAAQAARRPGGRRK